MAILKKILIVGMLFLISCGSKNKVSGNMKMIISDKSVSDNSYINITIYNHTDQNVYIPLDISNIGQDVELLGPLEEERFFFAMKNLENTSENKWIAIITPCDEFEYIGNLMEKKIKKFES